MDNYVSNKLDIVNYFQTLNKFDHIKSMIFNPNQITALNLIKKPNLNNKVELTNYEVNKKKIEEMIDYFQININGNLLTQQDEYMLERIDSDIKKMFIYSN